MSADTEAAIQILSDKLLQPIGIHLSKDTIYAAFQCQDSAVNDLQISIYMLIAHILFNKNNQREAREWVKKCNMDIAREVLALLGFDPFLFNLDNNSEHLLVALCWLVWRADLFKSLYDPYMPADDTYLPPYGVLFADPNDSSPKPIQKPPEDHDELIKRIQRLTGRISYQLQTLSDLEMARETLHWQIRSIDPDSDLYGLSLKASPDLLGQHISALKNAVENGPRLQAIAKQEATFYRWAFMLTDNLNIEIDPDTFERTRSLPCEWFPPLTRTPYTTHNQGVDDLQAAISEMNQKMDLARKKFSGIRKSEITAGLNGRQIALIQHEIDDVMDKLERLDEIQVEEKEDHKISLIPELELTKYSDTQLERLIQVSERKCQKIAAESCPKIAETIKRICKEMRFEPHGWQIDEMPQIKSDDDNEDDVDMQNNIHQKATHHAHKTQLTAPKQLSRIPSKNEKNPISVDVPPKSDKIPKKAPIAANPQKKSTIPSKKGTKMKPAGRLPFKNQPDMQF